MRVLPVTTTAGTPADRYLLDDAHPYDPAPPTHDARPHCRVCGGERAEHPIPTPRTKEDQ